MVKKKMEAKEVSQIQNPKMLFTIQKETLLEVLRIAKSNNEEIRFYLGEYGTLKVYDLDISETSLLALNITNCLVSSYENVENHFLVVNIKDFEKAVRSFPNNSTLNIIMEDQKTTIMGENQKVEIYSVKSDKRIYFPSLPITYVEVRTKTKIMREIFRTINKKAKKITFKSLGDNSIQILAIDTFNEFKFEKTLTIDKETNILVLKEISASYEQIDQLYKLFNSIKSEYVTLKFKTKDNSFPVLEITTSTDKYSLAFWLAPEVEE